MKLVSLEKMATGVYSSSFLTLTIIWISSGLSNLGVRGQGKYAKLATHVTYLHYSCYMYILYR